MKNRFNILYNPVDTWKHIKEKNFSISQVYIRVLVIMALLPPLFAFIGAVYSGWKIGNEEPVKLTWQSALNISIAAYLAILLGAYIFSRLIHWMAKTYGSDATLSDCFALVVYSCIPLFLVSVFSAYPVLWLDMLLTLIAVAFSVRLLFLGTPIMMGINSERAFFFSNSIITVGLVLVVAALAMSVLFWAHGVGPVFTR